MAGFERAVEDVDAVVRYVRERSVVNQDQLIIGGVSRSGILAIAYAGCGRIHSEVWSISTLWLHGSYDQYYRIGHCRGNFERFLAAGGQEKFVAAPHGHALMFKPALWKNDLNQYMDEITMSQESD